MNIMMVAVSCTMHQLNVSLLNILGITSSFFAKRFVTWKSNNTWRSYRTEKVGCPTAMSFYLSAQKVFSCCSINLHPVSSIPYVPVCKVGGRWFKFQLEQHSESYWSNWGESAAFCKDCVWLDFIFSDQYMYNILYAPSHNSNSIIINSAGCYRTNVLFIESTIQ